MFFSNRSFFFSIASVTGFTFAGMAYAADVPSEPSKSKDGTIVVTGQKQSREEVRRKASAFVRTATVIPAEDQYARRHDPLCPVVSGVDAKYRLIVTTKIAAISESVGLKVAKSGCSANLLVHFTNDVDGYIAGMAKIRPDLLRTMQPQERTALKQSTVPMRWLYATEARGSDGMKLSLGGKAASVLVSGQPGLGSNSAVEAVNLQSNRGTLNTYAASLIDTQMIVRLATTIVIIDVEKSTGFSLESVAAYAAMVSLAQVKLSTDYSSYPSILSMFSGAKDSSDAPRDLSEWDYAYLRALYATPPNRVSRAQRTRIYGEMVKQLTK